MFNRLPESNAQRQKRGGGLVVSTVVHVVMIALAVRATALTATPPDRAPTEPLLILPLTEAPRTARPPTSQPVRPTSEVTPTIDAPPPRVDWTDISPTIPEPGSMGDLIRELAFDRPSIATSGGGGTPTSPNVPNGQPLTERSVDWPVVALPGSAAPRYPSLLQSAGVDGDVRAQFVVDTLGRVEPGTVRILESSHESFSQAVRDALVRARFVPAEAGGRKVRQLVEQPFSFKLTGR